MLEGQLEAWRGLLAGAPAALPLPTDRPRPALRSQRGTTRRAALPAALVEDLRGLARSQGTTLFMALLAGFDALLAAWSGARDVVVATTYANRRDRALEPLIGFFVNPVLLRTDLSGRPSFGELLARVRRTVLAASANQDVPYEKVTERLRAADPEWWSPLPQVIFTLQNTPLPRLALPGLELSPLGADDGTTKAELELAFFDGGDGGLAGSLTYDRELFDAATMARFLAHLEVLLGAAAAAPETALEALPLLRPAEEAQLRMEHNDSARIWPRETPATLHGLVLWRAEVAPEAVAVVYEDEVLSYGELARRARALAAILACHGAGPERLVAVAMERSLELPVALLAVLVAGGAYVPLDPSYPEERLRFMLADSGAPVVLTQARLLPALESLAAGSAARWLAVDDLPAGEPAEITTPQEGPTVEHQDGLAYVIYTSGSTGRPKGAMNHHRGIVNRLQWMQEAYGLVASDRVLHKTPVSFDVSVWELFWPLVAGACMVVARPGGHREPAYLAALLAEERITTLHFVPSMLQAFLGEEAPAATAVRRVIASGEALSWELKESFYRRFGPSAELPGAELHNLYGPTEAAIDVTAWACAPGGSLRPVPIGRPVANTRVHLLGPGGRLAPLGVPGEAVLAGPQLARGYWRRPALTASTFVPDPLASRPGERLYRTGDLARRLPGGEVEFLGRLDHQVKVRGFRIELGEVEGALEAHPGVRQAVAVVWEEAGEMGRLVAYLVPAAAGGPAPGAEELIPFLAERLPEQMVPSAFVSLPELPLSPSGKVDRRRLPAPSAEGLRGAGAFAPPRSPLERALAAVWQEVLGLASSEASSLGLDDNFFAFGGDSIRMLQVRQKAAERGIGLSAQDLFSAPTLRQLARLADAGGALEDDDLGGRPFSLLAAGDKQRLPPGIEDAYPVTALQAGMLFHGEWSRGTATYHDVETLRLRGRLVPRHLADALAQVITRHPVLRTSFDLSSFGEPLQLVHREVGVRLPVRDLAGLDESAAEAAVAAWMAGERRSPFDWRRPPLLRAVLFVRGEGDWEVGVAFHHAILDGWSNATLLSEWLRIYLSLLEGSDAELPPVPEGTQRRFVALERQSAAEGEDEAFWQKELAGARPTRLGRWPEEAGVERGEGVRVVPVPLAAELAEGLVELGRRAQVPLKTVLLAAHLRALALASGSAEVVTGVVFNGRPETQGADRALGLYLATLPLRVPVGRDNGLDLLARTFDAERQALAHARYPVARLPALQGSEPLAEVLFNFNHFHVLEGVRDLPGVELLGWQSYQETNFALTASFNQDAFAGRLTLDLHADARRLAPAQLRLLVGYYAQALESLVRDPEAGWQPIFLLTPGERHRLLVEVTGEGKAPAPEETVVEALARVAERQPEALALTVAGRPALTFAQLTSRVRRLARRLRGLGVGPEVRVALCAEPSPELVVGLLAVLEAGGAYVPLDPGDPAERLAYVLADSGARLLLTQERWLSRLGAAAVEAVLLDGVAEVESGPEADDGRESPLAAPAPGHLAYVLYTSGSTGRPKGVMVEHRSLMGYLRWAGESLLAGVDHLPWTTRITFDASLKQLFGPLLAGRAVRIPAPGALSDPAALAAALEVPPELAGQGAFNAVPTLWGALLDAIEAGQVAPPRGLGLLLLGGEALPGRLVERTRKALPGLEIVNLYGPTELTSNASFDRVDSSGTVTLGRSAAGARLHVLGPGLEPLPDGVAGGLYGAGTGVARGYLGRPAWTAERFLPDPFSGEPGIRLYATGDRVRRRPDGRLEFLGRLDEQVKIRGHRVELAEVESALAALPDLAEVAVAARRLGGDGDGPLSLVAYCVPRSGRLPAAGELRSALAAVLPEAMVPARFVELPALPRLPSGKVDRRALPAPGAGDGLDESAGEPPRTPLERLLADLWAAVLRRPVGIHDNFFDLGGDSIVSLQIIVRARQAGLALEPRQIFEQPTVARLAAVVGEAPPVAAEQGPVSGPLSLTPIQRRFFELGFEEEHHWNQSLLLALRRRLEPARLGAALEAVVEHHDALRTTFQRRSDGRVEARIAELPARLPLSVCDLTGLRAEGARVALPAVAARVQASLDLARGPLTRACLFRLAEGDQLLWVAHHLVVDAVSWRFLVEDLEAAVKALEAGEAASLPPKTTSFQSWSDALEKHSRSAAVVAEGDFWRRQAGHPDADLPLDLPGDAGTVGQAASFTVSLGGDASRALLDRHAGGERGAPAGSRVEEALLAALMSAASGWWGSTALRVELEGHGREPISGEVDVARTAGWFTTVFPLLLEGSPGESVAETLAAVRRRLRALPGRGLGYGLLRYLAGGDDLAAAPGVSFNYLGRVDLALPEGEIFALLGTGTGGDRSPRGKRHHPLEVVALVAGGRLQATWTYSPELHLASTVEGLAESFLAALGELAAVPAREDGPGGEALSGDALGELLAELNDGSRRGGR